MTVDFNQQYANWVLASDDVEVQPANLNLPPLPGQGTAPSDLTDTTDWIVNLSAPPSPGVYNIVLQDDPSSTALIWNMTGPVTLGELTIVPPPVVPPPATLSTANDLGTIGTQVQTIAGSLDLSSQANVDLYKITLGPGHFWSLGVELDARRIGSNLLGALTLFDQSGNVLATRDSGTGLPNSPNDPYIFTGLKPGVYYIGVSGAGNLGGPAPGYDPVSGTIGSAGLAQAGGPYALQVVADPADSLSQVVGFSLQKADALDPIPTGVSLSFSGTIDPNSLLSSSPILVRDASGNTWPVTLSGYEGSQVSFAFEQPLPPGQYTVVVPPSGGLTDLTGRAPASAGQNPGVLATFTVEPQTSKPAAGNLGVLWPNTQYEVSQSATILPGQEVVDRVVILATGFYTLDTTFSQGSVEVLRAGPDGVADVRAANGGSSNSVPMYLEPGVYCVSFRTVGEQPAVGQWSFHCSSIDHESIINNGVGQGGALSLSLINPMTSSSNNGAPSGPSPVPPGNVEPIVPPSSPQPGSNTILLAAPVTSGEAFAATGVSVIPTSLMVTVNTGLLGTPSSQNDSVAVVGPVVAGGSTALASSFSGLLPGIIYRSSGSHDEYAPGQTDPGPAAVNSSAPATELAEAKVSSSADPGVTLASASNADAQALIKADRITELAGRLSRWFGLKTGDQGATVDGAPADSEQLVQNEPEPGKSREDGSTENSTERTTEADLEMPIGLIVVAAAAYRLRQFAGGWWRRTRGQARVPSRPEVAPSGPGPHSFRGSHRSHVEATRVRASRHR